MEKEKRKTNLCNASFIYLLTTLVVTSLATGLLSTTMMSDFWEMVTYNKSRVQEIATAHNGSHKLTWLCDGKVARIVQYSEINKTPSIVFPLLNSAGLQTRRQPLSERPSMSISMAIDLETSAYVEESHSRLGRTRQTVQKREISNKKEHQQWHQHVDSAQVTEYSHWNRRSNGDFRHKSRLKRDAKIIFLLPLHGGIWQLCIDLTANDMRILREMGMTHKLCTEYLINASAYSNNDTARHDHHVQSKMHNLSISCAMVCVILLGSAALLGLFGILQRQISAVLITGVMYILAALFSLFSLTIMHFKRSSHRDCGILNDSISREYHEARVFLTGWSMHMGWAGTCLMFFASLLWIFLAKVMRYNQLTFW